MNALLSLVVAGVVLGVCWSWAVANAEVFFTFLVLAAIVVDAVCNAIDPKGARKENLFR